MKESNLYINPAEIARPFAERLVRKGLLNDQEVSREENASLVVAEQQAAELGLLDRQYLIAAGRSVLLTRPRGEDNRASAVFFDDLYFEGEFKTYSTVRLGEIGLHTIRAFCLTFDNVRALPGIDMLTDDESLFYVPAFAVTEIDAVS